MNHNQILAFIKTVRESFNFAEEVYTEGSCFRFYLILKGLVPSASPYYVHGHVHTLIDGKTYDITGQTFPCLDDVEPMDADEREYYKATKWHYRDLDFIRSRKLNHGWKKTGGKKS